MATGGSGGAQINPYVTHSQDLAGIHFRETWSVKRSMWSARVSSQYYPFSDGIPSTFPKRGSMQECFRIPSSVVCESSVN